MWKRNVDLMICPLSPALYIRETKFHHSSAVFSRSKKKNTIASNKQMKKTMDTLANFFFSADLCVIWHPHWRILHCLQHVIHTANVCENYWVATKTNARTHATQLSNVNTSIERDEFQAKAGGERRKKKTNRENYIHTFDHWPNKNLISWTHKNTVGDKNLEKKKIK